MIKTINSDLIRGHIDTIILSVLHESDRYGYDILGEIEKKSGGEYVLKQPTLYSCLKRLESQGFIYKYWGTETNGGRRTYYSLTDMGKELFLKNKTDWRYSRTVIDRLISTADDPITSIQIENLSNESNDEELSTSAVINEQTSPSVNENNFDESEIKNEVVYTLVEEKAQSESYDAHEQVSSNEKNDENIDNNIEDNIAIQENYLNVIADAEKDEIFSEKTTSSIDNDAEYDARNVNGYSFAERLNRDEVKSSTDSEDLSYFSASVPNSGKNGADFDGLNQDTQDYFSYMEDDDDVDETPDSDFIPYSDKPFYDESDFKHDTNEMLVTETPLFRSYNNAVLSEETDRELVVGREYRQVIKQLLIGDNEQHFDILEKSVDNTFPSPITENNSQSDWPINEGLSNKEIKSTTVKSQSKFDDFDNLMLSVRSMGDEVHIRSYDENSDKKYNELYSYYSNKLTLFKYGILFALMILEIVIPYFVIKFGCNINIFAELPTLIISVLGAAILPVYSVTAFLLDPFKRKTYEFNLKTSLLYRLGIMLLFWILIYALNVVLYMDISFEAEYAFSLISPALLTTNIPFSAVLFKKLFDSKQFAIK